MKYDVSYTLDKDLRCEIVNVKNSILKEEVNIDIFLFGSIAKGRYKKDSDIDLLILLKLDKDTKELRIIRHKFEDIIEKLKIQRSIDIKLYSNKRYNQLCTSVGFEREIEKDLIDIREW